MSNEDEVKFMETTARFMDDVVKELCQIVAAQDEKIARIERAYCADQRGILLLDSIVRRLADIRERLSNVHQTWIYDRANDGYQKVLGVFRATVFYGRPLFTGENQSILANVGGYVYYAREYRISTDTLMQEAEELRMLIESTLRRG